MKRKFLVDDDQRDVKHEIQFSFMFVRGARSGRRCIVTARHGAGLRARLTRAEVCEPVHVLQMRSKPTVSFGVICNEHAASSRAAFAGTHAAARSGWTAVRSGTIWRGHARPPMPVVHERARREAIVAAPCGMLESTAAHDLRCAAAPMRVVAKTVVMLRLRVIPTMRAVAEPKSVPSRGLSLTCSVSSVSLVESARV